MTYDDDDDISPFRMAFFIAVCNNREFGDGSGSPSTYIVVGEWKHLAVISHSWLLQCLPHCWQTHQVISEYDLCISLFHTSVNHSFSRYHLHLWKVQLFMHTSAYSEFCWHLDAHAVGGIPCSHARIVAAVLDFLLISDFVSWSATSTKLFLKVKMRIFRSQKQGLDKSCFLQIIRASLNGFNVKCLDKHLYIFKFNNKALALINFVKCSHASPLRSSFSSLPRWSCMCDQHSWSMIAPWIWMPWCATN